MTCTCARKRMRLLGVPLACLLVSVPLNACAEIEVGAEVAKRISRASQATDLAPVAAEPAAVSAQQIQLAQASTNSNQTQAISPFLKPAPEIFEATGLAVWLLARPGTVHVGASGLVFGWFGFVVALGVLERSVRAIAGAVLVLLIYGGMVWGMLPNQGVQISWEAHFFGAVAGALIAWALRDKRKGILRA